MNVPKNKAYKYYKYYDTDIDKDVYIKNFVLLYMYNNIILSYYVSVYFPLKFHLIEI